VVVGKAKIVDPPAHYVVDITLRTQATLTPRARATFPGLALSTGPRWYKGDLHVHSRESGDAVATMDEIVALARQRGLDFVVLSDHNTVAQHALQAAHQSTVTDVLLMRGAEVTTYQGHGNAVGASVYVDHRMGLDGRSVTALLSDVAAAGGLFVVNHPELDLGNACIGCAWRHVDTPWNLVAAMEIHTGPYEPVASLFTPLVLQRWEELHAAGHRITAVGGSDDHKAGVDVGNYQSPLGSPTTRVFATELSEAAIMEGLRAGRVTVALRGPDDPVVTLTLNDGMLGSTVATHQGRLTARVEGGAGMVLVLLRNGRTLQSFDITGGDETHTVDVVPGADGDRFRAHLLLGDKDVVVTNHIYATFAQPPPSTPPPARVCACVHTPSGTPWMLFFTVLCGRLALRRRR